tara:strand:+ start:269 stop:1765 length:1497 start_codon:yes stop_codon:yes gene_type:complete
MKEVTFLDNYLNQLFYKKDTFNDVQNIEGKVFREYENRITKQFEAQDKKYFIKFHGPVGWREIFKNLFQIKTPVIGAQREYEALNHLSKNNINCPQIKGFGKKGINPANSSSFIITEELYGTLSLEEFFLKNLHKNLSFNQKCNLIKASASIIRKMHSSGLNHRDLYLCHLHVKEDIDFNNIKIYLIDLHRAQIRSSVPLRWIIKDLGGFFHSAIQFNFTERDFYRFLMSYFDCSLGDLFGRHQHIIGKILDRAFSMYLKPNLKKFSRNDSLIDSKDSEFDIHSFNSGKLFIEKNLDLNQFTPFLNDESILISEGEVIKNEKGHLIVKIKIMDRYFFVKKYRIKNISHGISRLIKKTRALNSWLMIYWLNAVGIRTAKPILLYEENGVLGARSSFLITEEIEGKRLDEAIDQNTNLDLVVARIENFFKRMNWIKVSHGDAKTSNFFINQKGLVTFDLDSSKRRKLNFFHNKAISKDKNRILKSLEKNDQAYLKLARRL